MNVKDWLRDFSPVKVKDNLKVAHVGGKQTVYYAEGDINFHLHVSPEEVEIVKQSDMTTKLQNEICEASTHKLAPIEDALNLLPDQTRQQVVAATVFNSSLDAVKKR